MPQSKEKTVLIIGGGVAALAAAAALVESNQKGNPVTFKVHIVTQAHRWGGRASSWMGGRHGPHLDLRLWPEDIILDHGFHIVFPPNTYKNFWHTFSMPWKNGHDDGYEGLRKRLCSNRREFLIYEKDLVRLNYKKEGLLEKMRNAYAFWGSGGWSLAELYSFYRVVLSEVLKYTTFEELQHVDEYADEEFGGWCLKRGLRESILNKQVFEFISDASYVSPFKFDAATALRACWVTLRNCEASEFSYIDGGITQEIMDPLAEHLKDNRVFCTQFTRLTKFVLGNSPGHVIGYEVEKIKGHPDSLRNEDAPSDQKLEHVNGSGGGHDDSRHPDHHHTPKIENDPLPKIEDVDYYISTIPIDNFFEVITASGMIDSFPNVKELKTNRRFPAPVRTMNLQAWFQEKVIPDHIDNVLAGLEPACVMIDYKGILKTYQDDKKWPGSVLQINGSAEELLQEYPNVKLGQPDDPETIEFAKMIMADIAKKYKFPDLLHAIQYEVFLERTDEWKERKRWKGDKIPPFLLINTHSHNRFFVTSPGTLQYRPGIITPYSNLFLAGDWTRNGFNCACMEGAARSGRMAAKAIQEMEGISKDNCINIYDPD